MPILFYFWWGGGVRSENEMVRICKLGRHLGKVRGMKCVWFRRQIRGYVRRRQ